MNITWRQGRHRMCSGLATTCNLPATYVRKPLLWSRTLFQPFHAFPQTVNPSLKIVLVAGTRLADFAAVSFASIDIYQTTFVVIPNSNLFTRFLKLLITDYRLFE